METSWSRGGQLQVGRTVLGAWGNVGGASPPILNEMSDGWSNLSVQCSEITYYVITY